MFNSFCEIDAGTFGNPVEVEKFEFNRLANGRWPGLLERIRADAGANVSAGFGTYLINNSGSDTLEDENFDQILAALHRYEEPFEEVNPREIPHYRPEARHRASRALYIPREGWVNPIELIEALSTILARSPNVRFVDDICVRLSQKAGRVTAAWTEHSGEVTAEQFLVCNGASFSSLVDASNLGIDFQRVFYGVGATVLLETGIETLSNCIRTPNRGLACGLYSAPQSSHETVVGASNFISPGPTLHVRLTSIYTILRSIMEQLNQAYYRAELIRINVGWRPTSSDTLPMLGATSIANLFVATGTKRDGLHCSPVIAEFIADLLVEGKSAYQFELFNPERKLNRYLPRDAAIATLVRHTMNAAYQHDFVPAKNRMSEDLEAYYTMEFTKLHDDVGALTWGIPAELKDMYRYGHIK